MGEFVSRVEKGSIKIWLLNSSLAIASNALFATNSSVTKWLEIYSDGILAHSTSIYDNITTDSIKVTS
jgi:hypothetical protein